MRALDSDSVCMEYISFNCIFCYFGVVVQITLEQNKTTRMVRKIHIHFYVVSECMSEVHLLDICHCNRKILFSCFQVSIFKVTDLGENKIRHKESEQNRPWHWVIPCRTTYLKCLSFHIITTQSSKNNAIYNIEIQLLFPNNL